MNYYEGKTKELDIAWYFYEIDTVSIDSQSTHSREQRLLVLRVNGVLFICTMSLWYII